MRYRPFTFWQRSKPDLYSRIRTILESARTNIARSVNSTQVIANWFVGCEIVENEQHGNIKAGYGKKVIIELSERLQKDFGNGYSVQNLFYMRQFYSEYPSLVANKQILHALRGELDGTEKFHALRGKSIAAICHQMDDLRLKNARFRGFCIDHSHPKTCPAHARPYGKPVLPDFARYVVQPDTNRTLRRGMRESSRLITNDISTCYNCQYGTEPDTNRTLRVTDISGSH